MTAIRQLRRRLALAVKAIAGRTLRSALSMTDAEVVRSMALPGAAHGGAADAERLEAHFLRRSTTERLPFPGHIADQSGVLSSDALTRAEDVTRYRFEYANLAPVEFGERVDWGYDPTDDPRKRWARALNRHLWMPLLVAAYQRTEEESFARAFVDLTTSWITANPPPPERDESSVSWNLMNVGIRCMIWPAAFLAFQRSPSFSRAAKLLMLRSVLDHGRFLCRFRTHGNHLLRESNGLANLAGSFPEFPESTRWRDAALDRLATELANQVNSDGSHYEMSMAYQWMVIEEFEATRDVLGRFGWRLPAGDLDKILARMYRVLVATQAPGGAWPQLNDGFFDTWSSYAERLTNAPNLSECSDPAIGEGSRSLYLPNAGLAVMRSSGGAARGADHYLIVKAGPYGGLHGHEDKLSIELHIGDRPFLVDPGTCTYNAADPFRSYFVSSHAHNTVTVDGRSQVRRFQAEHRLPRRTDQAAGAWSSQPAFDLFSERYADGYAEFAFYPRADDLARIDRSVEHVRTILYVRDRYWLVVDDLLADGIHEYARRFQCAEGIRVKRTANGALLVSDQAPPLWIVAAESGTRLEIEQGASDPIGGWVSNGRLGHRTPAPQLTLLDRSSGPVRLITLICPDPAMGSPGYETVEVAADAEPPGDPDLLRIRVRTSQWADRIELSGYRHCESAELRIQRDEHAGGSQALASVGVIAPGNADPR